MGGIGPREAAVVEMFQGFADPATLLTVGLAMSFGVQVLPAILGIPWMFPLLRSLAEFELPQCDEKQATKRTGERNSPAQLGAGRCLSQDAEVISDA